MFPEGGSVGMRATATILTCDVLVPHRAPDSSFRRVPCWRARGLSHIVPGPGRIDCGIRKGATAVTIAKAHPLESCPGSQRSQTGSGFMLCAICRMISR